MASPRSLEDNPDQLTNNTYERLIDNVKAQLKRLNQTLNVLESHKRQHTGQFEEAGILNQILFS